MLIENTKKINLVFVFPENAECGQQGTGIFSGYYIYFVVIAYSNNVYFLQFRGTL